LIEECFPFCIPPILSRSSPICFTLFSYLPHDLPGVPLLSFCRLTWPHQVECIPPRDYLSSFSSGTGSFPVDGLPSLHYPFVFFLHVFGLLLSKIGLNGHKSCNANPFFPQAPFLGLDSRLYFSLCSMLERFPLIAQVSFFGVAHLAPFPLPIAAFFSPFVYFLFVPFSFFLFPLERVPSRCVPCFSCCGYQSSITSCVSLLLALLSFSFELLSVPRGPFVIFFSGCLLYPEVGIPFSLFPL